MCTYGRAPYSDLLSRKMPPRPINVIPNFEDTMREFMKIFSGNPVLYREGITKHPWVEPILWQTRGLRQNYLTNHPRLSARDNAIQSTPPGNLRKRTRRIAPGTADLFRNRILPKVIFGNPVVPGVNDFSDNTDILITDDMYAPVPPVYHHLYPGVFPQAPIEMFDGALRSMHFIMERIMFMLRTWFRRALRNAPTRQRPVRRRLE